MFCLVTKHYDPNGLSGSEDKENNMSVDMIGYGNDDGTNFGRSDDKIGFYGLETPIVKPTVTFAAASTTTVASSVAADLWALRVALNALGLITSA